MVTHPNRPLLSLSTREDMERSTDQEFPSPTTLLLRIHSEKSTDLQALKILFTRLPLVDLTSRKLTTSSGHSSSTPQERASLRRDILITTVEFGVTERTKSTNWSRECFEHDCFASQDTILLKYFNPYISLLLI